MKLRFLFEDVVSICDNYFNSESVTSIFQLYI